MNTKQDELCVDVLAAIAWADEQMSEAEMERTILAADAKGIEARDDA
jgi:hypothetical protein